ncbi:MAG: anthranilate phosphoribosyltransferase [Thermoanaerobaculales bacterium]|jgi:anthranilate phosphoribosyltransferase|nr:anthranilate phosphoribosyltransferase [Thermoanaerobaculales bacterium]
MTIDTKRILNALLDGNDLGADEMEAVVGAIMDGGIDSIQTAGILAALRAKGESGVEVAAAARAMRQRAVRVNAPAGAIDTCGTGGDGADTINISTASAIVAAAAGVPVAKHGNRAVSSSCGSADVLEALGVRLDLGVPELETVLDEVGIAFLFAQVHHPATRAVVPVRKALGVRTVFNLLGPLTNPAGVRRQVMGVWGAEVQPLAAEALAALGAEHALVLHSDDGLDELSVVAPTTVVEVRGGELTGSWKLDPADLGIRITDPERLRGGDVGESARRLSAILEGSETSSASEAVALNAAAALYVGAKVGSLSEGLEAARDLLASGAAGRTLEELAARSQELGRG